MTTLHPAALASLREIMAHRGAFHAQFRAGDCVIFGERVYDVVSRRGSMLLLDPRDGAPHRIAPDHECDVAPHEMW